MRCRSRGKIRVVVGVVLKAYGVAAVGFFMEGGDRGHGLPFKPWPALAALREGGLPVP